MYCKFVSDTRYRCGTCDLYVRIYCLSPALRLSSMRFVMSLYVYTQSPARSSAGTPETRAECEAWVGLGALYELGVADINNYDLL